MTPIKTEKIARNTENIRNFPNEGLSYEERLKKVIERDPLHYGIYDKNYWDQKIKNTN